MHVNKGGGMGILVPIKWRDPHLYALVNYHPPKKSLAPSALATATITLIEPPSKRPREAEYIEYTYQSCHFALAGKKKALASNVQNTFEQYPPMV